MYLQHCLLSECVDFISTSSVNVFSPATYRTILLKVWFMLLIKPFSPFFKRLRHVAYIHVTNCFILCFTESFISDKEHDTFLYKWLLKEIMIVGDVY